MGGEEVLLSYLSGFELHHGAPLAGHLAELRPAAPDASGNGVVCTGEKTFSLELEVGEQVLRVVTCCACVAEFYHHLSKEDPTRIHVRHRDHVFCRDSACYWRVARMCVLFTYRRPLDDPSTLCGSRPP